MGEMRAYAIVVVLGCLLCGCGDDGSGSGAGGGSSSSSASLPTHNPDAKFNGKGVLEYAAQLSDLNPAVQQRALNSIRKFGVDGLPARDKVRALVDSSAAPTIKVMALSVLAGMKDPDAQSLVRQKLADPEFSDKDVAYRGLLRGTKELGVDEATLQADLLAIYAKNPAHAVRLMKMRALPASVQNALAKTVFESDHDAATTQFFMQNLTTLHFLDDAQRVAYIKAHPAEASKQGQRAQAAAAAGRNRGGDGHDHRTHGASRPRVRQAPVPPRWSSSPARGRSIPAWCSRGSWTPSTRRRERRSSTR